MGGRYNEELHFATTAYHAEGAVQQQHKNEGAARFLTFFPISIYLHHMQAVCTSHANCGIYRSYFSMTSIYPPILISHVAKLLETSFEIQLG